MFLVKVLHMRKNPRLSQKNLQSLRPLLFLQRKAAHENMEINGGDDVDDGFPTEPQPTRHDVLKAASRYIEDINMPFACKLDALLGSFNRQLRLEGTRNMKETTLTDFFRNKVHKLAT